MAKTGWKKKLGTSKREQGIVTPKAPQNRKKKKVILIEKPKKWFENFILWLKSLWR